MAFPGYPFQEIEARQRAAWAAQPASPAPAESELKHFALTLPIVPGSAAGSFSELRRFVIADLHARLQRGQGGRVRLAASWNGFDAAIEKRARETGKRPAEIAERDREALRALLGDAAVTIDSQVET